MSEKRMPIGGLEGVRRATPEDLERERKLLGVKRSKETKRRQCIEFVWGQLPARMNMSMEDVRKALGEDD